MVRRKRRRPVDRDTFGTSPGKEWDDSLGKGSLVFLRSDALPHIYEVVEFDRRVLQAHDMYNYPSLMAKGLKEGDEIPPFLLLRRRYTAPFYEETPIRKVYNKRADGSQVSLVTAEFMSSFIRNLESVMSRLP